MTDEQDSAMDPKSSPTQPSRGVRRVNNLPVAIVGGAVSVFLGVIAYVAIGRASPDHRGQSDTSVRSARSVADEITRDYEAGEVAGPSPPSAAGAITTPSSPAGVPTASAAADAAKVPEGFPAPPPPPRTSLFDT